MDQGIDQIAGATKPEADEVHVAPPTSYICDRRFIEQLNALIALRQFLLDEMVELNPGGDESSNLEGLNLLSFNPTGRLPTIEEWRLLDDKYSMTISRMNIDLRMKFRIKKLGLFFGILPVVFMVTSILATIIYIMVTSYLVDDKYQVLYTAILLLCFVLWTIAQGGLGACAFVGTKLITRTVSASKEVPSNTVQSDIESADLTDRNYLKMRIVLGSLFALLLCFPISRISMEKMGNEFSSTNPTINPGDLIQIIVPFIVGFSTSLVLTILTKLVAAIQEFLGVPDGKNW
jgi:hypothetical protein